MICRPLWADDPQPDSPQPPAEQAAPSEESSEESPEANPADESAAPEQPAEEPAKPESEAQPAPEAKPEADKPAETPPAEKAESAEEKPAPEQPAEEAKPAEGEKKESAEPEMEPEDQAPKEEAEKPAEESEEKPADDAKGDDAPEEKPAESKPDESKPNESKPEEPEQPAPRTLDLDEATSKVLEKPYPQNVEDLLLIQKQTQRVVETATPATVSVRVGQAFGSAVIVSPDGLVLTAGHVVGQPGQDVTFIFSDGKTAKGKTLGMFREIDSGMMKITDPGPWPYVKLAKAGDIKTGQWVVAIGHPGGFDPERTPPVRLGRVLFSNDDVISTDCTLVGGDSGGPLYNMKGEVVGIHSRIGRRITDNFHVPISTYHSTWDRLASGEEWGRPLGGTEQAEARPLLGVTGNRYEPECKIADVYPGMPAAQAGLKSGDIVRKFNGKQVQSFDDLINMVFEQKPGDTVKIEVARGEETLNMELRLGLASKPLPGSAEKPEKKG
ncbi:trypsin-like peptidase domain-containing protein [Aeoliella mucimassa]|uniref:trypsin-like peptidase domain-containing protein n=1 Tax=Aeoliella mucimassa TaxID=2527972 RepID=UPI0018D35488|nr:trypsin-like peptidase domain-containing protein [Aeoliella mucimassa]